MGWVALAVIGGVAFAALRLLGVPRALGWFVGAALMLGAAGYALQQRASLPGHPVGAEAEAVDVDPGLVAFRGAIMPAPAGDAEVLAAADAQLRAGQTRAAAQGVLAAIARRPGDAALWTGLGSALAAHDAGQVSPAARFAFRRAWRLAPDQPGPPFFLGLAYLQAGEMAAAKVAWLRALALTPADASYRVDIAERLVMIDEFQAMAARAQPGR
ncbi:tetratricopeptide repeat protein [uncultured Sphingomonas sp.]|uniref:tetratricopeptide repeat protein n=1 Tax=uncultured Sphingomonas sp. TaxID=158754 RepID=UPI0035CBAC25